MATFCAKTIAQKNTRSAGKAKKYYPGHMIIKPIVYTCNIGQYDDMQPLSARAVEAYDLTETCDELHPDPRMQARFVKFHPHVVIPRTIQKENRYAIWKDANIDVYDGLFESFQLFINSGSAIGVHNHEHRSTLYEEFLAVLHLKTPKGSAQTTWQQAQHYASALLQPVFETGIVFFDTQHPMLHPIATRLWSELRRWGPRDQLALTKVLHDVSYEPFVIGPAIRANPYLQLRRHK
jgi:hypothetical protein